MSVKCGMRNSGSGIATRGGAAARSAAGATRLVRLGDVAEEVRENWSGPTADVPVVGLEHIEPDEIWLRKWEVNPDENTFSKAFRKGQLLFGRRRAYQKKLSLAPSDGICSGDITVFSAHRGKVVPPLLPFLLRTDKFFDYAIQGSAGSLSPRVKWSHISGYEFDLPPMDEQKKLAELLWAANDLKESYKKAINATDEMLKAKFREMFGDAGDDSSRGDAEARRIRKGKELFKFSSGKFLSSEKRLGSGIPVYGGNGIAWYTNKSLINFDTLVFGRVGEYCGNVRLVKHPAWITDNAIFIQDFKEKVFDLRFLYHYCKWIDFSRFASETGQPKITQAPLEDFEYKIPPLSLQREFVAIADKAESAKANLKKSIAAIDQVMKGLINQ